MTPEDRAYLFKMSDALLRSPRMHKEAEIPYEKAIAISDTCEQRDLLVQITHDLAIDWAVVLADIAARDRAAEGIDLKDTEESGDGL